MEPHCVLCEARVQAASVLAGTHVGSFRVMEPIPCLEITLAGTDTDTDLCSSSHVFVIIFSISSATT